MLKYIFFYRYIKWNRKSIQWKNCVEPVIKEEEKNVQIGRNHGHCNRTVNYFSWYWKRYQFIWEFRYGHRILARQTFDFVCHKLFIFCFILSVIVYFYWKLEDILVKRSVKLMLYVMSSRLLKVINLCTI